MTSKPAKKRNPQDATLRNIRALKAQVAALKTDLKHLTAVVVDLALEVHDQQRLVQVKRPKPIGANRKRKG